MENRELSQDEVDNISGGVKLKLSCQCNACGKEYYIATVDTNNLQGNTLKGTMICDRCGAKLTYNFQA